APAPLVGFPGRRRWLARHPSSGVHDRSKPTGPSAQSLMGSSASQAFAFVSLTGDNGTRPDRGGPKGTLAKAPTRRAETHRHDEEAVLRPDIGTQARNHAAFIWSVADLLRGDYKQSEYGKVILPLTVI